MTTRNGISIVVPAYNEEANLEPAVAEILAWISDSRRAAEIVIVDDGSRDATPEIADRLSAQHEQMRVIHHAVNRGYGAALASGFAATTHPLVFFTDADRQFCIDQIERLCAPIEDDDADMVIGYRVGRHDTRLRVLFSIIYNSLADLVFRTRARDLGCAFKLIPATFLHEVALYSSDFSVNTELVVKARRHGLRVREVGVTHRPRTAGTSSVRLRHVGIGLLGLWSLWLELHGLRRRSPTDPARATPDLME
ncbi:MAG: putative dolichol-phosphate mannosyltransferase-putative rane bound sugar transferase involved in [Chloroflexi bacterium]|nr:putative dolichol-phosphate mannosyltransferase-putative rane bound sugar transferase involved in [Chloroflexota bacterium]